MSKRKHIFESVKRIRKNAKAISTVNGRLDEGFFMNLIAKVLTPALKNHIKDDPNVLNAVKKLDSTTTELQQSIDNYVAKHGEDEWIKLLKTTYKFIK